MKPAVKAPATKTVQHSEDASVLHGPFETVAEKVVNGERLPYIELGQQPASSTSAAQISGTTEFCHGAESVSPTTRPLMCHYLSAPARHRGRVARAIGERLQTLAVEKAHLYRGESFVDLLSLQRGQRAVFRRELKGYNRPYEEVAAFRVSELLGLALIAPTFPCIIGGVRGSVQLFAHGKEGSQFVDPEAKGLVKWEATMPWDSPRVSALDGANARVLYALFGGWDLHAGNWRVSPDKRGKQHLVIYDVGGILTVAGKNWHPANRQDLAERRDKQVTSIQQMGSGLYRRLKRVTDADLRAAILPVAYERYGSFYEAGFDRKVDAEMADALVENRRRIIDHVDALIRNNGGSTAGILLD